MPPGDNAPSRWTLYSWALLFTYTFFQALQWPLLPRFLDIYYHLGVVEGFREAGGYVTTAFWEYAPAGRPHLYPPLLHIWMWMARQAGLEPITVGRLVDCLSFPALLAVFHRTVLRLAGPRPAFWALVLFSSCFSAAIASVTLSAFNLAFLLGLLALSEAERERKIFAALLLALCFYTHTLAAFLILLAFVLNAALCAPKRRGYLAAAASGVAAALPLLVYQLKFRDYFGFVRVHENRQWELDLLVWALLAAGLFLRKKVWRTSAARWAFCLFLAMSPLVLTHQTRFFSGHGLAPAAILAALAVEGLLELARRRSVRAEILAGAGILLFASFLAPSLEWDLKKGNGGVLWADRTLTAYLRPDEQRNFRSNAFTVYFQKPYEEIASVIRQNSEPGDLLWTDFSYTAGILGMMAGRATTCAMLAEMRPFEEADRLSDARIIVWFRDRDGKAVPEMERSAERRGWKALGETELAFLFENPSGYRKKRVPAPLIPSVVLWLAGLGSFGLALRSAVLSGRPAQRL